MEKVLILENGQKYSLSPINREEFDLSVNRGRTTHLLFDTFKRKHNYVELSDFSEFLLKNSKIEFRDGECKFIIKNYKYELDDQIDKKKCCCDGINEACGDCPIDENIVF